jgi:hypothetical protein
VGALAADLERYLAHEPVLARPASLGYRARKFARRHTAGVAAAGLVTAALVAGGVAAATGLVRARRAEAAARLSESAARADAATAREVSAFVTGLFRVSRPDRARARSWTRARPASSATSPRSRWCRRG